MTKKKPRTPPKKQPVAGQKKTEKPAKQKKTEKLGNIFDAFVKDMFGRIFLFAAFLQHYADPKFVSQIDLANIRAVPTHIFGKDGVEHIVDLIFKCPLKNGGMAVWAVILFEHQTTDLGDIPRKLLKNVSAIWDTEKKASEPLSAVYFLVLRTGKKPHKKPLPRMEDRLPKDENGDLIGSNVIVYYDCIDLPEYDTEQLVGPPELQLVMGMLKKMTEGCEMEWGDALRPLCEFQNLAEQKKWLEDMLPFVAKVFRAHGLKLKKEQLEQAIKPIFTERVEEIMLTIFEEAELKGETRGKAEGEARGKAESVIQVLSTRFKATPTTIEKKVSKITSIEKLTVLLERALSCDSLKSFANSLR